MLFKVVEQGLDGNRGEDEVFVKTLYIPDSPEEALDFCRNFGHALRMAKENAEANGEDLSVKELVSKAIGLYDTDAYAKGAVIIAQFPYTAEITF